MGEEERYKKKKNNKPPLWNWEHDFNQLAPPITGNAWIIV